MRSASLVLLCDRAVHLPWDSTAYLALSVLFISLYTRSVFIVISQQQL
ncbi:MAG TPA: hypothetical protein V6D14_04450 [Coleofasciculaceae cyanobacterium]